MNVFISADIEGCCGVTHWDEATRTHADYPPFQAQMQREVSAACEGALRAGADTIRIRDAHGSARNLNPWSLPPPAQLMREWSGHPHMMIQGLDATFDALIMVGYHSPANSGGHPLAHTISGDYAEIRVNGQPMAEFHLFSRMAACMGVPTVVVTGDAGLCALVRAENPAIHTVASGSGHGRALLARHPTMVVDEIRDTVAAALQHLPTVTAPVGPFHLQVTYRDQRLAHRGSFYPGAKQTAPRVVTLTTETWLDILRALVFLR